MYQPTFIFFLFIALISGPFLPIRVEGSQEEKKIQVKNATKLISGLSETIKEVGSTAKKCDSKSLPEIKKIPDNCELEDSIFPTSTTSTTSTTSLNENLQKHIHPIEFSKLLTRAVDNTATSKNGGVLNIDKDISLQIFYNRVNNNGYANLINNSWNLIAKNKNELVAYSNYLKKKYSNTSRVKDGQFNISEIQVWSSSSQSEDTFYSLMIFSEDVEGIGSENAKKINHDVKTALANSGNAIAKGFLNDNEKIYKNNPTMALLPFALKRKKNTNEIEGAINITKQCKVQHFFKTQFLPLVKHWKKDLYKDDQDHRRVIVDGIEIWPLNADEIRDFLSYFLKISEDVSSFNLNSMQRFWKKNENGDFISKYNPKIKLNIADPNTIPMYGKLIRHEFTGDKDSKHSSYYIQSDINPKDNVIANISDNDKNLAFAEISLNDLILSLKEFKKARDSNLNKEEGEEKGKDLQNYNVFKQKYENIKMQIKDMKYFVQNCAKVLKEVNDFEYFDSVPKSRQQKIKLWESILWDEKLQQLLIENYPNQNTDKEINLDNDSKNKSINEKIEIIENKYSKLEQCFIVMPETKDTKLFLTTERIDFLRKMIKAIFLDNKLFKQVKKITKNYQKDNANKDIKSEQTTNFHNLVKTTITNYISNVPKEIIRLEKEEETLFATP
ncbi:MAG: hypothetical protein HQK49_11995 [Oligoflexia bacterium]|nr:hypothetical protein [Oligoflexia bacterium]